MAARRTRTAEDDGLDPPLGGRTDEGEGGGKRGARQSERVKAMDGTGTDGERERERRVGETRQGAWNEPERRLVQHGRRFVTPHADKRAHIR